MLIQKITTDHLTLKAFDHQSLQDRIEGVDDQYILYQHGDSWYFYRGFIGANALAQAVDFANNSEMPITILVTNNPEACAALTHSLLDNIDTSLDEYDQNFHEFLKLAKIFAVMIKSISPSQGDNFLLELGRILMALDGRSNKSCVYKTQDCLTAIEDTLNNNSKIATPKNFARNSSGLRDLLIELAMAYLGSDDTKTIVKVNGEW